MILLDAQNPILEQKNKAPNRLIYYFQWYDRIYTARWQKVSYPA